MRSLAKPFPSGAQLNSELLANRLDIVSMADFPSIVGATMPSTQNNGVLDLSTLRRFRPALQGAGNALVGS